MGCCPFRFGERPLKPPLNHPSLTDLRTCRTAVENQIIEQALEILDERLFTRDPALDSPKTVASYLKLKLAAEEHEAFAVIFLDSKHRPMAFEILFRGTIDTATIHPRQLIKRAMAHNAAAVIISHNHPSGCTEPSSADIAITKRIQEALTLLDVRLIDHFIVGSGTPLSFAERGLI